MWVRIALAALVMSILGTAFVRAEDAPASKPAKVQPVDFRKLKEVVPEKVADQPRQKNEGEKVAAGEMIFTHVTSQFGPKEPGENAPSITLEIIDYAATETMAAAATAWQNIQIDRESDTGWEKTTKIGNYPAYQSYQNEGKNGQLQLFVAGRYYVSMQTTNLSSDDFKKAGESLPLAKLAELK